MPRFWLPILKWMPTPAVNCWKGCVVLWSEDLVHFPLVRLSSTYAITYGVEGIELYQDGLFNFKYVTTNNLPHLAARRNLRRRCGRRSGRRFSCGWR